MKKYQITTEITECAKSELSDDDLRLVQSAENFLTHAYAPYSRFSVAAAARLSDGTIINGTNQENAASPSGQCAERTAIFYANSAYPDQKITAIAITAHYQGQTVKNPITPCGACRQALLETEKRYKTPIRTILAGRDKCLIIQSISDILPLNFDNTYFD